MTQVLKTMEVIMADTYALYLKTQNYHWHVKGVRFNALHALFEMQYKELANAIDTVAERILTLGNKAPATFKQFERLKTIVDGDSSINANQMVTELAEDNKTLVKDLYKSVKIAQENYDEGTANLLIDRISAHEKAAWMLNASREQ